MKIQTLGLFINPEKSESRALVPQVVTACSAVGIALLAEPAIKVGLLDGAMVVPIEEMIEEADAVLVLGGDGTILRAIGCMRNSLKPILGINLGTLGFLAECMPDELTGAISRLACGDYTLERRMLLHARLEDEDAVFTALNDVVITRGSFTRMVRADVYVDGALAARYEGDGAIIASPTGSTAYSLSTGGPIVTPDMECFLLSPICAHTLSSRPIVVSAKSRVRMEITPRSADGGMLLSIDGNQCRILHEESALHIRRSERTLPFIRFGDNQFFSLLRNKLSQWGGAMLLDDNMRKDDDRR